MYLLKALEKMYYSSISRNTFKDCFMIDRYWIYGADTDTRGSRKIPKAIFSG